MTLGNLSIDRIILEKSPQTVTHYRETVDEVIHDWPYAMLQNQISYKPREAGIPVEAVEPWQTSIICRKCGQANPKHRDGSDFHCTRCGYEVHADVNAAIILAENLDNN